MSVFLGWSSALISAGTSTTTMQSTFSSLLSTTGAHPWQIVRQAIIGTPWSTGGTAFTNPGNAFDMTSSTSATTAALPAYIGITYASGFTPTVMYIQSDVATIGNTTPLTFTLDYSDNGSSWTTLQTFTSQTNWAYSERRKYIITGAASHNYWRMNVTAAQSGNSVNVAEFTLEDTNGNWLVTQNFFDCIPPTTETIGNSFSRECVRWIFPSAGTSIILKPVQELLTALPQTYSFTNATAGAVTCSVTINGNTVSYVGSGGNTAIQNSRGLFEAIKASVNANFTAWNWVWCSAIATLTGGANFLAINKTALQNITVTSSNITTGQRSTSVFTVPLVQGSQLSINSSITIDLINGWIYYLQICSRGLAIGSKTNANFYTPVHACYGDNASAISQLPTSDLSTYGLPCTPAELMVGLDNATTSTDGYAYITHWWGCSTGSGNTGALAAVDSGNTSANCAPFSHHVIPGQLQDYAQNAANTSSASYLGSGSYMELAGEGLFQSTDAGTIYSVHRLSCVGNTYSVYLELNSGAGQIRIIGPCYSNLDWYKFTGTAPSNEQLLVSPCNDFTTTISTTGLNTDTTINVASTTGFPSSGWLVLNGEIISYTGISGGNSFTGCVRGKYGTTPVSPVAGETIYIGAWFCFLVQGLIFAGYQTPT